MVARHHSAPAAKEPPADLDSDQVLESPFGEGTCSGQSPRRCARGVVGADAAAAAEAVAEHSDKLGRRLEAVARSEAERPGGMAACQRKARMAGSWP